MWLCIIKGEMDQGSQDSNSLQCLGVPETTLRFKTLPEGFTELGKPTILMVMVYYTKMIQANISHRKGTKKQHPRVTRCEFSLVLSIWCCVNSTYFSSNHMGIYKWSIDNKRRSLQLWCSEFLIGHSHVHMGDHLHG